VTSAAATPQLETIDLACGYAHAKRTVLSAVNLELRRGRFLCIIGPNGAGKTTLLRTLAGLLPPLSGEVRLAGVPIHGMHAGERARRLSVVLTRSDAPGFMTVERFVELGRHPYTDLLARLTRSDREAVDQALDHVGLGDLRERWMTEISDGERQRAAVARALAQAAQAMVLDEPTAFLDVAARASVMTTLRRIAHQTERLIVTTSHDVELVLRTADVVGTIDRHGELRMGSPEDLVINGAIGDLFTDRSLRFDQDTGTFRLPPPEGVPVALRGNGPVADWTAHAIERIGRPVIRLEADGRLEADERTEIAPRFAPRIPVVEVHTSGTLHWSIRRETRPDVSWKVHSLEELAEYLRE
jgi:iron complex transport system ATP-binding protein